MNDRHPRFFNLIFFGMVAALMSGAVSFVVTTVNLSGDLGLSGALLVEWLKAWAFAYPIAFPVAMIVSPACRKLTWKILGHVPPGEKAQSDAVSSDS